jgi:hypothetical protein
VLIFFVGLFANLAEGFLFDGREIREDRIPDIYPYLSGLENLQLCGRLRSMPERP